VVPSLVFQSIGPLEIGLIVLVLLLVFGVSRVSDIGGALGRSIREFRREVREGQKDEEETKPEPRSEAKVEPRSEEGKAPPPPSGSAMSH
jgi:sec-independent protein translocase protein TatA